MGPAFTCRRVGEGHMISDIWDYVRGGVRTLTLTLTLPCSFSCSRIMSTSSTLHRWVSSDTLPVISSMATSIGFNSALCCSTTWIRFFRYGKLALAAEQCEEVNQEVPVDLGGISSMKAVLTCQDGPSLALLFHVSVFFSWQSEWRLVHKASDVVVSFKIRPFLLLLFVIKVRNHICDLDVGELWVQVFGIYLLGL